MKTTTASFVRAKSENRKLAMVTAYDYTTARLADSCGVDAILVGDSLGMVCLGYPDTLSVTMDDMVHHTRAVSRGTHDALLVSDLPFLSCHISIRDTVLNAGRLIQEGGAQAVKLEGGSGVLPQVRAIIRAQIPVMGHLGLTPQSVNLFGGYKVQGRDAMTACQLLEDARRLADAGVFGIVLECMPAELAQRICESIPVPVIGIGAGAGCDGQILVYHDLLGVYTDLHPKFVKVFADAGATMREGLRAYVTAVRDGTFPGPEHAYTMDPEILGYLYGNSAKESSVE